MVTRLVCWARQDERDAMDKWLCGSRGSCAGADLLRHVSHVLAALLLVAIGFLRNRKCYCMLLLTLPVTAWVAGRVAGQGARQDAMRAAARSGRRGYSAAVRGL